MSWHALVGSALPELVARVLSVLVRAMLVLGWWKFYWLVFCSQIACVVDDSQLKVD